MKKHFKQYYFIPISILLFSNSVAFTQSLQLGWDASSHPYISHYGIYRTTHIDSSFKLISTVQHPDTIYRDENLQWGTHYFSV